MFCSTCGSEIPNDAYVCPSCNAKLRDFKFCKHCGQKIDPDCVVCPKCGKQVEELRQKLETPQIIINNSNNNVNTSTNSNQNFNGGYYGETPKNKWVAFLLCLFLGSLGAHKFYEGKIGTGILYLCTAGLFCIRWLIDIFKYLAKPNPYYVS